MEFPVLWFPLPVSSCLAGHYWGGSAISLSSHQVFTDITEVSLLHAEQLQLSHLLSVRCCNSVIIFVALHWACSRASMSPFSWHIPAQEWAQHSKCGLTRLWYKGQTHPFVGSCSAAQEAAGCTGHIHQLRWLRWGCTGLQLCIHTPPEGWPDIHFLLALSNLPLSPDLSKIIESILTVTFGTSSAFSGATDQIPQIHACHHWP